jgi:two-component system cell cycle response regulator
MTQVLIIEDNEANLELMTYLLTAFGYNSLGASSGTQGLALARSINVDLIICDVQLPDIDGYEVARQIKADATLHAVPLLAVTALAMVGDRDQILAAGFDGYLAKPIVPETFVKDVEAFLPAEKRATGQPASAAAPAAAAVLPHKQQGVTILVVDDQALNHELMRSVLEPFGYAVLTANSVLEAMHLAQAFHPQLIISDLHMPHQSGFDLIRAVKADAALRDIKIMIHSATVRSERDHNEALRLGASAFITRPMEPTVILAEIAQCLQGSVEHDYGNYSGS